MRPALLCPTCITWSTTQRPSQVHLARSSFVHILGFALQLEEQAAHVKPASISPVDTAASAPQAPSRPIRPCRSPPNSPPPLDQRTAPSSAPRASPSTVNSTVGHVYVAPADQQAIPAGQPSTPLSARPFPRRTSFPHHRPPTRTPRKSPSGLKRSRSG